MVTILDLGSGTGYCSRRLNRPDFRVINVDLAWAMLVQARILQELETDYVCADAESLPIRDRSIDIVFCNLVIQWCPVPESLFTEVHRILQPGGIFVFSTLGPNTLSELRDAWKRVDFNSHVNPFPECSTIRSAISRSGLENLAIERDFMKIDYPDVIELMRELKGIGAHNVTSDRPRTLTGKGKINRVIGEYKNINPDQTISATFELIFGRCNRRGGPDAE